MSIIKICDCGSKDIDVSSANEKIIIVGVSEMSIVEINYICKSCGSMESELHHLYKDKINKSRKEGQKKNNKNTNTLKEKDM